MSPPAHSAPRYYRSRWSAIAIAALLLIAQALAAAHVHPLAPARSFETQSHAVAVEDGLCALCLFHFNCPVSAGPPAFTARPALVEASLSSPVAGRRLSSVKSCRFGRAPPLPS